VPAEGSTRLPTIAIIGGGLSGCLLAIHLLRSAKSDLEVIVIERRPIFGCGTAYSTSNPAHLLNIRVGNMSLFEEDPLHFLRWLNHRRPPIGGLWRQDMFAPRALFGAYVEEMLQRAQSDSRHARLRQIRAQAIDLTYNGRKLTVKLISAEEVTADRVVLCMGNFPPVAPTPTLPQLRHFLDDPWNSNALRNIQPDEPVLVLGTGLTMVDLLLDLAGRAHRAPVLALSRHGLLPRVHEPGIANPLFASAETAPCTITALLRSVRAQHRRGADWRSLLDGLRPQVPALWQRLSEPERRRFLRHLQPWWEVHRHRVAPEVAAYLECGQAAGRHQVRAGRLIKAAWRGGAIDAEWRPRGGQANQLFRAKWIVNCTGPLCDYQRIRDPLVRRLLARGLVRPDPLRLGLDVTANGSVRDHSGEALEQVFALGPPSRGTFWEITSVPEIRRQAAELANHLLACPMPDGQRTWIPLEPKIDHLASNI
jgi:uncharacterized NAD(P)/FAD-binding protein YdhS